MYFYQKLLPILYRVARALGIDLYAEEGFSPETVADFSGQYNDGEYFRVAGVERTFDQMFTYSGASFKTMTDSNGKLKWAPHNTVTTSDDLSATYITNFRSTDTQDATTDPLGGSNGDRVVEDNTASATHGMYFNNPNTLVVGEQYDFSVCLKAGDRTHACLGFSSASQITDSNADLLYVNLSTGAKGDDNTGDTNGTVVDLGSGWYLCTVTVTCASASAFDPAVYMATGTTTGDVTFSGDATTYANGIYIWGWSLRRSDLGGMVDNPDPDLALYPQYVATSGSAVYLPRRNSYRYLGSTYGNKGILLESAAATNLQVYSSEFDNAAWIKTGATISANADTSPDGTTNADRLTSTNTSSRGVYDGHTVSSATTYCQSIYAKAGTVDWIALQWNAFDTNYSMCFDLTNGTTGSALSGTTAAPTFGIEDVGGGWYRCYITASTTTDLTGFIFYQVLSADDTLATSGYISIYGAQLEASSVPTSYIPTSGATATRAAETLTIAGSNMAHSISGVSIQASGEISYTDTSSSTEFGLYQWNNGTDELNVYGSTLNTRTGQLYFGGRTTADGGYTLNTSETYLSPGLNVPFNAALRNSASEFNGAEGGTALTADTTPNSVPAVSGDDFSFGVANATTIAKHITFSLFRQWAVDIGDAGIERASDRYEVASLGPATVADFAGESTGGREYFRTNGVETDFDTMFTYTGASTKVMTDSDGNLKWAPHNEVERSDMEDDWLATGGTRTLAQSDPDGGTNAILVDSAYIDGRADIVAGHSYKVGVIVKAGTADAVAIGGAGRAGNTYIAVTLSTQTVDSEGTGWSGTTITDYGDGWYYVESIYAVTDTETTSIFLRSDGLVGSDDGTSYWYAPRLYAYDGINMVDNPDRGDSYVLTTTTAAVYLPRRNSYRYDGGSVVKKGITVESEAATNLITDSETFNFGTTSWAAGNAQSLVLDDQATGPDGTTSAGVLYDDSSTGTGAIYANFNVTVSTSTAYTFSCYAKQKQLSIIALGTYNFTTPSDQSTYFNLSTGAVGTTGAAHTANIEDVGNGWYRCSITFTTDSSDTTGTVRLALSQSDGSLVVDRDGTSDVYIYGAQAEAGSVPSSYIPTSGATATRAAETLTIAAANMAYSGTGMSTHLKGEANLYNDSTTTYWFRWPTTGTIADCITTRLATDDVQAIQDSSTSVLAVSAKANITLGVNAPINYATRHTADDVQIAFEGTAQTADTEIGSLQNLSASDASLAGLKHVGTIALFRQWDADLAEAGIEEASS